jgi:hypothetical protein
MGKVFRLRGTKMKKKFGELKQGQEFVYRNSYYIKDDLNCAVRLTGKNAGYVMPHHMISDSTIVRPVTLIAEEE